MMKYLFFLCVMMNSFADDVSQSQELKEKLYKITQISHKPITYKQANNFIFTKLDNHQGAVCSVYSAKTCLMTDGVPSHKIMNIEHTWPQSDGANGDAKSDLHHIFPVESSVNSIRASLPFCDVEDIKWSKDNSKRGYGKFMEHCFGPPAEHVGNVARALFYFSIRYRMPIDQNQEYYLRKWNKADPVDQMEIERNNLIKEFQNNLNPFILDSSLADQIIDF